MQFTLLFRFSLLLSLFFFNGYFTAAQEMITKQYTTRQGLPIDQVYCAAQDHNGFMWFGTDFGIVYFDGLNFKHYYKKEGIANKAVLDIIQMGGDSLVFISYPDAIQSIHRNNRVVTLADSFNKRFGFKPQMLELLGDQLIIYQRNTDKFALMDRNNRISIIKTDSLTGIKGTVLNKIISLQSGKEYILCTNKGAFKVTEHKTVAITEPLPITCAFYSNNHQLWLTGERGIFRSEKPGTKPVLLPVQLPSGFRVQEITVENDGTVLFCGSDKAILQLENNQLNDITEKLLPKKNKANRFFRDDENNTWICTNGAGIILKKKTPFKNLTYEGALENNNITCLLPVKDGLLVGTGNGLSLLNAGNKFTRLNIPGPAGSQQHVFCLYNAGETGAGAAIQNSIMNGKAYQVQNSVAGPLLLSQSSFSAFTNGKRWLYDEGKNSMQVYISGSTIPEQEINLGFTGCRKVFSALFYENEYWIGTDKGIAVVGPAGRRHIKTLLNDKLEQVFKLLPAKNNTLWIATDNGVYYYKQNKYFKIPDGRSIPANYCPDMIEGPAGNIWVATWDGIYYTNGTVKKRFNVQDGLASRTVNSIVFDVSGKKLYAGTSNGLSVLNIEDTLRAFQKKAFISCHLSDSEEALEANHHFGPGSYNLVFDISIPEYGDPEEINIQYRLDNGDWILSKRLTVNMDDVSSGEHHFFVRPYLPGTDAVGPDSEFVFNIKERFIETWWFRLLMVLLALAFIIWVVLVANKRIRKKALIKHQQLLELATLRQKAFTTLINPHFIFNALNSIQNYINKQDRQAANRYLSDFASLIRRNFDAAQQAFIPLDQELENIRLYLQLEQMRFPGKFEYELFVADEVDAEEQFVPSMILQPFLENAILHGLSSRKETGLLKVALLRKPNALLVTITDNGIGIEKSRAMQSGSRHKSRGMQLIREKLSVLSRFGDTPVTLDVEEAFPGSEYPGVQIRMMIPDSIYKNFPGDEVTHW